MSSLATSLYAQETDTLVALLEGAAPQGPGAATTSGAFDDRVQLLWAAPESNTVLGCRVAGARELGARNWQRHLDRPLIPLLLLQALDRWFDAQEPPDSLVNGAH